ncbi:unnamed protein product [Angiostrongylus costaricensis]|uniref:Uncharacterized protein n=1 Tax=Angiostrongylus costaricensis TaxID=334426 RepID=A0A0R3PHV7_ANGCS|nr:unnamed protein product [Angiostrongylus costaricensis]
MTIAYLCRLCREAIKFSSPEKTWGVAISCNMPFYGRKAASDLNEIFDCFPPIKTDNGNAANSSSGGDKRLGAISALMAGAFVHARTAINPHSPLDSANERQTYLQGRMDCVLQRLASRQYWSTPRSLLHMVARLSDVFRSTRTVRGLDPPRTTHAVSALSQAQSKTLSLATNRSTDLGRRRFNLALRRPDPQHFSMPTVTKSEKKPVACPSAQESLEFKGFCQEGTNLI